uniref:GB1/RHD3-type G domain-containing protein n=1 Tax=Parascaris univalens TaxID=6257 RepID=A0A915C881_PARUN
MTPAVISGKPVLLIEIKDESNSRSPKEESSSSTSGSEEGSPAPRKVSFKCDKSLLRKICDRARKGGAQKVAVISIAGVFREGKSFLLNFFLDYLYALQNFQMNDRSLPDLPVRRLRYGIHRHSSAEEAGPSSGSPKKIEWLTGGKVFEGFVSKRGIERVTTGVWIWNEPIILRTDRGYRLAVFLIDTQGIMDKTQSFGNCAAIFGLSTMISSVQIYNVMKLINESHLQSLSVFSDFGRNVQPEGSKGANSQRDRLQNLIIAVRDYQFADSFPHGGEGGKKYLESVLKCSGNDEGAITRHRLENCFNRICCYLLPHPGLKVTENPLFDGDISDMNPEFVKHVKMLVEETCDPNAIETKKIDNTQLTPEMFYEHVNNCIIAINDDTQPLPMSLTTANMQMRCYAAAERAKNFYRLNVARQMCFRDLSAVEFKQLHEDALARALKLYGNAVVDCESGDCIQDHERKLENFLNDEYEMLAMNVSVAETTKKQQRKLIRNFSRKSYKTRFIQSRVCGIASSISQSLQDRNYLQKLIRNFSRKSYKTRFIQSRVCGIALCVATIASSIVLVFSSRFSASPDFLLSLVPIVCVTTLAIWCCAHLRYLYQKHQQSDRSNEITNVPLLSIV